MKKIEKAITSRFTQVNRFGNLSAIWYEDGKKETDEVRSNKNNRDYYYNKVKAAYQELIEAAPAQNQDRLKSMLQAYLDDTFTSDSYMLSVICNVNDHSTMIKALIPYMSK